MGSSTYTSNIKAGGSAVTISGFSSVTATAIAGTFTGNITGNVTGNLSGATTTVTSYIKLGSHQYILFGGSGTLASIAAIATAIDASCQGSLYLSSQGKVGIMESDTAASFIPY